MKRKREEIETTKDGDHSSDSTVEDREQIQPVSKFKRQKTKIDEIPTEFLETQKKPRKTVTWAEDVKQDIDLESDIASDNNKGNQGKDITIRKKYTLVPTSTEEATKKFDEIDHFDMMYYEELIAECFDKKQFSKLIKSLKKFSFDDQIKILYVGNSFIEASSKYNIDALQFIVDNVPMPILKKMLNIGGGAILFSMVCKEQDGNIIDSKERIEIFKIFLSISYKIITQVFCKYLNQMTATLSEIENTGVEHIEGAKQGVTERLKLLTEKIAPDFDTALNEIPSKKSINNLQADTIPKAKFTELVKQRNQENCQSIP